MLKCEKDAKLKNLLAAVMLQILKNDASFGDNSNNVAEVIKILLQVVIQDKKSEFPLLALQNILRNQTGFCIETVYTDLSLCQRYVLLDILAEEKLESLDKNIVMFLVKMFKHQSTILMTILKKREEVAEPKEMSKILNILGCISYLDECQPLLQNEKGLLIDAVYLLRMVHDVGKENKLNLFSSVQNMEQVLNREKMESDPVFGFKRDLIRLIGNLCYEQKENQDQVREINGIELLLDCSSIDGKNPFIREWVVFAIGNICCGNPPNRENQKVLYSIDKTGKMDKKLLEEIGVQIEEM